MKETYIIDTKLLSVYNEIEEYNELIIKRFLSFEKFNGKSENYLKIGKSLTRVKINDLQYEIKGFLQKTDLFFLINNIIANTLNNSSNIYIHSGVIGKEEKGILLLGNFRQGKTTLSLKSLEYGFKIYSSDQSWMTINDGELFLTKGSMYVKELGSKTELSEQVVNSKIKIVKIILLYGLAKNGEFNESIITNGNHNIKNIFPFCNWHSNIPMFTDGTQLSINNHDIKSALEKITKLKLPISIIRGDIDTVLQNLDKEMEMH